MRVWLLTIGMLLSSIVASQCLKADIIFMLDWSGSEDSNRVYIPSAAYDFVNTLTLGPSSVKIGVIPFNEDPIVHRVLPLSYNKDTINSTLFGLMGTEPSGGTSFPSAFQMADSLFARSQKERNEPALQVIIFISDGEEGLYTRPNTLCLARYLKNNGVFIWCISTPGNAYNTGSKDHLKQIASTGCYLEEYYVDLKEELLRLDVCP